MSQLQINKAVNGISAASQLSQKKNKQMNKTNIEHISTAALMYCCYIHEANTLHPLAFSQ